MNAQFLRQERPAALDKLADRRLFRELSYVNGQWTASMDGHTFEVTDPATGESLAWVSALDTHQTTKAIDAASAAFPKWRALLPQARAKILRDWYERILAAKADLALLMTLEQGKPLAESLGEI